MPHIVNTRPGDPLESVAADLREAQELIDHIIGNLEANRATLELLEVTLKFLRGRLSTKDEEELADEVKALLRVLHVTGIFGTEEDTGLVASKDAIVKEIADKVASHLGRG